MKLVENLHHSDESSGTTIVDDNGTEIRAHWTEGFSDVIITEGMGGPVVGVIRANGETSHNDWEALKPILANPGEKARAMTEKEETDHDRAQGNY